MTDAPTGGATSAGGEGEAPSAPTVVFFKPKKGAKNKRSIRGNMRKRRKEDLSDSDSSGDDGGGGGAGAGAKRRGGKARRATDKIGAGSIAASSTSSSAAAGSATGDAGFKVGVVQSTRSAEAAHVGGGATASLEIDTAHDRDARALLEKSIALSAAAVEGAVAAGDDAEAAEAAATGASTGPKLYKGEAAYRDYLGKSAESVSLGKITGTMGPLRASSNIRSTTIFDYAPDVCKDYKETGYCGYGDACKFLHDRGDYKMGWQIEREWQEEQKKKEAARAAGKVLGDAGDGDGDGDGSGNGGDKDALPFACFICRKPFIRPVVTRCKHYFCSACALGRYAKGNTTCAACKKQTGGSFNPAKAIVDRLAKLQRAEQGSSSNDASSSSSAAAPPKTAPTTAGWNTVKKQ